MSVNASSEKNNHPEDIKNLHFDTKHRNKGNGVKMWIILTFLMIFL